MKKDGNDVEGVYGLQNPDKSHLQWKQTARYSDLKAAGTDLAGNPLVLAEKWI